MNLKQLKKLTKGIILVISLLLPLITKKKW